MGNFIPNLVLSASFHYKRKMKNFENFAGDEVHYVATYEESIQE